MSGGGRGYATEIKVGLQPADSLSLYGITGAGLAGWERGRPAGGAALGRG